VPCKVYKPVFISTPSCEDNLFRTRLVFSTALLLALAGTPLLAQPAGAASAKAKPEAKQKKESELKRSKEAAKGTKEAKSEAPAAKEEKPHDPMSAATFTGLAFRNIGPATTSGRVLDIAVNPNDRAQWYVATVGGVWKTNNAGTTWTPIFDHEGAYSIATVVIDPQDTNVIWVGTGENNSQRSVSYGDGVYRSDDGGKTWKNMGLKSSEHIGKILIDPRKPDTVFVAAQGPLWGPGGDRGLYKTTDGGKTWKPVLQISKYTGVTDVAMDPSNPDTMYAASYQRERKQYTIIDGGPESAIYKSTDAGETWHKLTNGLPGGDLGRIGLAVSPSDPNVVYAVIEASGKKGGIFRSNDKGASWEKRNDSDPTAQYYSEIWVDPKNPDRLYYPNTMMLVSDDGGKTFHMQNTRSKHVDNHALWIDPNDTDYMLVGCDGGVYETYDRGDTWNFKSNLPITQFYDVDADNAKPFYFVYGGTQDNYSLGGPSQTRNVNGIVNADWFVTQGGDGFHSRVDPEDPNTVYAEAQYGALVRFDRRTGQALGIQPVEAKGEAPNRWNWDSPILVSPFNHTHIYFASQRLYRSEDRGNSWKEISGDLTRNLDRNTLPVMGKIWGPDAVAKDASTSFFGNIVALDESPLKEGLIYVGTDDGVIQVTEDGGAHWTKYDKFPGLPEITYVSRIFASRFDVNTVYASFDNHKNEDFKPYLFKSTDTGKTWTSISSNLPENGSVLAFAEDTVNPNLLFAGTEFGAYFTIDGGKKWIQLKGGMPTIAIHDLTIQKRESDLVAASFGRGFFILDNITPLRVLKPADLEKEADLFPVKDTMMYVQASPLGGRGKGFHGDQYFTAPNPSYGATFTYYLKDDFKTKKQLREEAEKKAEKEGKPFPYPTNAELTAEAQEQAPQVFFTVIDADGKPLRRVPAMNAPGIHRGAWDLRYPNPILMSPRRAGGEEDYGRERSMGPLVLPGKYGVVLDKEQGGVVTTLTGPVWFNVYAEGTPAMSPADLQSLLTFQQKVSRLYRAVTGAVRTAGDASSRLKDIQRALNDAPSADPNLLVRTVALEKQLDALQIELSGNQVLAARNINIPPSIAGRVEGILEDTRMSIQPPTQTHMDSYSVASEEFTDVMTKLRVLVDQDLSQLQKDVQAAGAPWVPGQLPDWKPE